MSRDSIFRLGAAVCVLLSLLAAVEALAGADYWAGPTISAALICLALSSRGFPLLRPWTFTLWVAAAVVAGLAFPTWFIGVGDFKFTALFKPLLMLIMFCMGATLSVADFANVLRFPIPVFIGLLCQFTIMPFLGYTIATSFGFPAEVAAGVVLVGVSPSGLASNVMSYIARANVALSVTITALASLMSPILTPLLMHWLAGEMIAMNTGHMMVEIAEMVVMPIVGGLVFHHLLLHRLQWIDRILPFISMFGIIAMTVLTVAIGRDNLLQVGPLLLAACLLHNLGGFTLGYWASQMLGMDQLTARTVAIEVGMQNCGLASGIAASLNKVATLGLAPIIFGPIMNTTASLLANWWRNHPPDALAPDYSAP